MRVVHLTSVHPWGDTRIFAKMAVSCAEHGHETHIVALDRSLEKLSVFRERGVQVHLLAGRDIQSRIARASLGARRAIRYTCQLRPDIVHFHDPELALWVGLTRMGRTRKIYDVHENLPDQIKTKAWIPAPLKSVVARCAAASELLPTPLFAGVITATPKIAERFPTHKTIVIRNFPVLGELDAPEICQDGLKRIVYVGGITAPRGIPQLVDAVELVDEIDTLDLAGPISPPELLDQLKSRTGWRKVRYFGDLRNGTTDRQHIARILCGAVAGAVTLQPFPSYLDAYPVKTFEYLSVGLPVLASDFPLWRSMLAGVDNVEFVDPQQPASIAAGIRRILSLPTEIARLRSNAAKRFVVTSASWQSEVEKMLESYDRWSSRDYPG